MSRFCRAGGAAIAALFAFGVPAASPAEAETLEEALSYTYKTNPQLNSERAALRAIDEGVPMALSDYRPRVNATLDAGVSAIRERGSAGERQSATTAPRGVGVTASQIVYNGLQTANRVRAAEARVFAGRETLRIVEQT